MVPSAVKLICLLFLARLRFPLYISQDGNQSDIAQLARSYAPSVYHMQHLEADSFPERKQSEPIAYYRIASHYKFMMRQMFDCLKYPKLIILEVCLTLLLLSPSCVCMRPATLHPPLANPHMGFVRLMSEGLMFIQQLAVVDLIATGFKQC